MGVIGVKRFMSALVLVLALSIVGCAKSATPSESDNAAAKNVVRAYWAAVAARDPQAAEKLFVTVDGTDVGSSSRKTSPIHKRTRLRRSSASCGSTGSRTG